MIKKAVATGGLTALVLFGLYEGVDAHKNYRLQQISNEFPHYVEKFEKQYGHFKRIPQLEFQSLDDYTSGEAFGYTVIVNNSLSHHIGYITDSPFIALFSDSEARRHIINHELAHIYTRFLPKEDNTLWTQIIGNIAFQRRVETSRVLHEGIADYMSSQNSSLLTKDYIPYYNFVKPVLDRFGVEDGIRKLFEEPPSMDEFKAPQKYYKRLGLELKV